MSFVNNLFGSIAGSSSLARIPAGVRFLPTDAEGGKLYLDAKAQWLGLRNNLMQKWAYEFCYPIASVIDHLAEMDVNGVLEIRKIKGKGKDAIAKSSFATQLKKLLDRPNPKQSWWQFRMQQVAYKKIFGYCPVLPILRSGFEGEPHTAIAIINLPPWLVTPVGTSSTQPFSTNIDDVDPGYRVTILGKNITLRASQLIMLKDTFMEDESTNFQLPLSKLVGLDWVVSNICKAMEADNVLLSKKGPLGIFSHAPKADPTGYSPMNPEEHKELQEALDKYGLSHQQWQYLVSRASIQWIPTSFNVAELGTKETVIQCEKAACHRYNFPYVLYEQSEATYANGDNASATVYQDNVIPNNNRDMGEYDRFFNTAANDCELVCNYDAVGSLQEDKQAEAETQKTVIDTRVSILSAGISLAAKRVLLIETGLDETTVDEMLVEDEPKVDDTTKLEDDKNATPPNPAIEK